MKDRWYIAEVIILFQKLKGQVKTESGKKMIHPEEWFMPLVDNPKFKWMSFQTPERIARLATEEEILNHFNP